MVKCNNGSATRMWNKDFILLVQGQGVSCLGSTLYSVVASLWVYELTGSTVIMSTVYAASNIARLIAFPFAGIIVDRFRRRDLIVFCDAMCGISMLAVALIAFHGSQTAVWALVIYSAVSGVCSGVFSPSVNTLMISIAGSKHYVRANSVFSTVEYGIDILGQAIAGTLYLLLGAPVLFLVNGISYLFSSATEVFISKDAKPIRKEREPFIKEATEGVRFIVKNRGVCANLFLAFSINFAFGILKVVLVPWMLTFGEECYGLLESFKSSGVIIGTVLLAARNLPEKKRHSVYFWCQIIFGFCIAISTQMRNFWVIAILFCVAYANQYVFNSLQRSAVFISAPDEIRGKVICAVQALAMGFSAIGNLAGGFVCEVIDPQPLVFGLMILLLMEIVLIARQREVRNLFCVNQAPVE